MSLLGRFPAVERSGAKRFDWGEAYAANRDHRRTFLRRKTVESKSLETTEAECAQGRTAPRVSLSDIKAKIASEYYYNAGSLARSFEHPEHPSLDVLTICLVVLDNGFTIIGKSAPASPDNFDEALGQKLAYEDAVRQIWPLMGFALRERLYARVVDGLEG